MIIGSIGNKLQQLFFILNLHILIIQTGWQGRELKKHPVGVFSEAARLQGWTGSDAQDYVF